jgi:hypothetical protein
MPKRRRRSRDLEEQDGFRVQMYEHPPLPKVSIPATFLPVSAPLGASETQKLPGGTTRSEKSPTFHLVPPEGARRIAKRFELGAAVHGTDNWKLALTSSDGRSAFARSALDHMHEHLLKLEAGEVPEDDHLAAIGWAVYALAFVEARYGPLRGLK